MLCSVWRYSARVFGSEFCAMSIRFYAFVIPSNRMWYIVVSDCYIQTGEMNWILKWKPRDSFSPKLWSSLRTACNPIEFHNKLQIQVQKQIIDAIPTVKYEKILSAYKGVFCCWNSNWNWSKLYYTIVRLKKNELKIHTTMAFDMANKIISCMALFSRIYFNHV